ncbi:MAG: CBS domain-containing protein [Kineosporiaceae bacterium]
MKVREVMSTRPIVVGERSGEVSGLMRTAGVHHVPVVEAGRLVGLWLATEEGPLVMLGPEHVHETTADADASKALEALAGGAAAVLVWDAGTAAGVLTRTDLIALVRAALGRGLGRRHPRPLVIRLAGPAGAGKTTLLVRTLALLGRLEVAVVQANAATAADDGRLAGAHAIDEPGAHWRAGLARVVERLADSQLIMVEDLDGPVDLTHGIGEDLQVAVVPATALAELSPDRLADAQALVATRADEAPENDVEDALAAFRTGCPGLHTFATAAGHDDRGLAAWAHWIEGEALRRHG